MKTARRIPYDVAIVLTLSFSFTACDRHESSSTLEPAPAPAAEPHEAHAGPASAPLLPEGQLWPTDAPLRTAMSRIQSAVEDSQPAFDAGTLTAADAQVLAEKIATDVHYMIENCKLPPEPDAALHALIARLLTAANAVKSNPTAPLGVPELAAVVHDYRATFDHSATDVSR